MLNNFWPWSVISALRKDLAATQKQITRLRGEVDALTLQKMILQEQVKNASKNDAKDSRGRFTSQKQ